MKKNVMMRVASALLVAVLMTTCAISGTFAKYTTTASGRDSARVAKWGFNTDSITVDLFDDVYGTTVDSADGKKVVAPGTTSFATIDFTPAGGTPEVSYTFDVNVALGTADAALVAKLVWKLNDVEVGDFAALVAKVNEVCDKEYAPGQEPADIKITWEWPFEEGANADEIKVNDKEDTDLGNTAASLEVIVSYTATQKD